MASGGLPEHRSTFPALPAHAGSSAIKAPRPGDADSVGLAAARTPGLSRHLWGAEGGVGVGGMQETSVRELLGWSDLGRGFPGKDILVIVIPGPVFTGLFAVWARPYHRLNPDYERLKIQCVRAMSDLQSLQNQHTNALKRCEEVAKETDFYQ